MATGRVPTTANSPLTAKGDLFGYSTTQARVAVGNNGETLVADSSTSTGLRWAADWNTGKNKIINGDFGIWQRGTSFTAAAGNVVTFSADRFYSQRDGSGATVTVSQQTFTPGAAPVAGYEGQFFIRYAQTVAGSGGTYAIAIGQNIEDVRTLAGQTVTISFWAKADATRTVTLGFNQNFGSGGSATTNTGAGDRTLSTSWARYTLTATLPSVSGKTIGSSSYLNFYLSPQTVNQIQTFDVWGLQIEAGSVATPFTTATGTLAGELAACQRYYQVIGGGASVFPLVSAYANASGNELRWPISFPVTMRVAPTITRNGTWSAGNCGQPAAVMNGIHGFSMQITASGAGMCFSFPDSTDDNFTMSAEL